MRSRESSGQMLLVTRAVFTCAVLLFARVGESTRLAPGPLDTKIRIAIYILAAGDIAAMLWLRSLGLRKLKSKAADQPSYLVALRQWRLIQFSILSVFLSVAIFGFILRVLGETLIQSAPFYGAGIALLWFVPLDEA